jgi:hypothetical protein
MKTFPDIDRLKATLDPHRRQDPAIVRNLREDLIVRWSFLSNSSESYRLRDLDPVGAGRGFDVGVFPSGCEFFHKETCNIRIICENIPNRPATPLEEAHQGGCFIFRRCCG